MKLSKELKQRILEGIATLDELAAVPIEEIFAVRSDPENVQWSHNYNAALHAGDAITDDGGRTRVLMAPSARSISYLMSSERGVGSMGDSILVNGWQLDEFEQRKRPFLFHHNLVDVVNAGTPLGRMDNVRKGRARGMRALLGDAVFTPEGMDPFNDRIYTFVANDWMPGGSVGFRTVQSRLPQNEDERAELGVGQFGMIIEKAKLIEFSATPVPMDPAATKLTAINRNLDAAVRSGEFTRDQANHLREMLRMEPQTRTQVHGFGEGVFAKPKPGYPPEMTAMTEDTSNIITFSNSDHLPLSFTTNYGLLAGIPSLREENEALRTRMTDLEHDLADARACIDEQGRRCEALAQNMRSILEALGVRSAEAPPEAKVERSIYDDLFTDETLVALFGGDTENQKD